MSTEATTNGNSRGTSWEIRRSSIRTHVQRDTLEFLDERVAERGEIVLNAGVGGKHHTTDHVSDDARRKVAEPVGHRVHAKCWGAQQPPDDEIVERAVDQAENVAEA